MIAMNDKIDLINKTIDAYFKKNKSIEIICAKDLMSEFIEAGIFNKDDTNGLPIRNILRKLDDENSLHLIPFIKVERKKAKRYWFFTRSKMEQHPEIIQTKKTPISTHKQSKPKDETYILDLCDEVLSKEGIRQHKFDFLLGDSGVKLPVDIFYKELSLVIEYREYQHTHAVKHFDKPDKITVSGVHRGEQRKIYDQRRRDVLPKHNISLVEISYNDFSFDRKYRVVRNNTENLEVVKKLLKKFL